MNSDLIDVVLIGEIPSDFAERVLVTDLPPQQAQGFSIRHHHDDSAIEDVFAQRVPHVIVTVGHVDAFPKLLASQLELRRRWIHFDNQPNPAELARTILNVFVDVATRHRFADRPLVSVFTPTFRTGSRIYRAYDSLLAQRYDNWEWVVYDDSPDDETFELLVKIAESDARVKPFRSFRNCGVIGEVKRRCTGLCCGSIMVELDHDDRLMPNCLDDLVAAFAAFPDCGFAYTDCAEVFEDGESAWYGEEFAFGFGSYRRERHDDREYLVTNYPSINAKTIRHIVGVPNHVRAWTRDALVAAGGYSSEVHVADDYELLIRTFLTTRMVHVQRLGYVQVHSRTGGNTHRQRSAEIQRLVGLFQSRYDDEIHARFEELAVEDFIWTPDGLDWSRPLPDPVPIANRQWPPPSGAQL
jgi:glycosyltransferase involved in cell wall biosynthesis